MVLTVTQTGFNEQIPDMKSTQTSLFIGVQMSILEFLHCVTCASDIHFNWGCLPDSKNVLSKSSGWVLS